jgi:hypothetical protein
MNILAIKRITLIRFIIIFTCLIGLYELKLSSTSIEILDNGFNRIANRKKSSSFDQIYSCTFDTNNCSMSFTRTDNVTVELKDKESISYGFFSSSYTITDVTSISEYFGL